MSEVIDPHEFRRVLGHFPTGVAAVTSLDDAGQAIGMAVGSFTSVSLSPPLVAFLPDKRSSTFPKIRRSGRFCVNVLAARQEAVCRALAGPRKFDDVDWTPSTTGMPRVTEAIAWIECEIDAVHDAGDHEIVVGRVLALEAGAASLPLLFFQGGYGRFAPLSFAAVEEPDLVEQLRLVDVARPYMEAVAQRTQVECLASTAVGDDVVLMATAGSPAGRRPPSRVGQRMPLLPPLGTALVAWSPSATAAWFARVQRPLSPEVRHQFETLLSRVRERGWSVATGSETHRELEAMLGRTTLEGLTPNDTRELRDLIDRLGGEYEPEDIDDEARHYRIRNVSVPVFSAPDQVAMVLTLYGLPSTTGRTELDQYIAAATAAAKQVSSALRDTSSGGTGSHTAHAPSPGSMTARPVMGRGGGSRGSD